MAGRLVKAVRQTTVGVAATGVITVTSSAGLYERAIAYLSAVGEPGVRVQITEVTDATHIKVRLLPMDAGIGGSRSGSDFDSTDVEGTGPNYGQSDLSDYDGGTLNQPEQLVYNRNDAPLS